MASKINNLNSSCRTCMKSNANLVDLYQTVKIDDNCLQLVELLIQCTTLKVSKEDKRPQNLCHECVQILQASYHFRNQALECEEKFKKLLDNDIKIEPTDLELKEENDQDFHDDYNEFESFFNTEPPKSESEIRDYECNKCNKSFKNEKKFLKHLGTHDKPLLSCSVCNKFTHSQSSLDKHAAKHHGNKIFPERDSKPVNLESVLEDTECVVKTEEEDQKQFIQCTHCDLTFSKQRSLAMHMKKHKNKIKSKSFICDICGKAFTKKPMLKRHVMIHSDSKPYKCNKCPKQYSRHDQYTHHIYTHKEDKPYVCSHCKKGFAQLCSLKDHLRVHTGETPYLCSECGKGFANSSNLRQHMMRHTGLKPYACKLCPKTFCTKGQMTSHMSTHTGEHPYKCEECGAAFTKANSLKKHSYIHLGVRPFACDTCNMRFTCKDHLKRHCRIHTGEKPYRCNYCDRSFTQSNDLVKHTRGHIGQNIYQCTICSARFRLLSELKLHYPVHFGKNNDGTEPQQPEKPVDITKVTNKPPDRDFSLPQRKPATIKDSVINKDLSFLKLGIDKELPNITVKPFDKTLPLLTLKPQANDYISIPEVKTQDLDNRITITINGCDKNGVVGDITINIDNNDS